MTTSIALTWDYRCPFARIANDHVLTALAAGADLDVTFVPFSLGQVHREDGQPDVWDAPETDSGLFALQVGVALRDQFPDQFAAGHRAIFEHRHAGGGHLRTPEQLRPVLEGAGIDADKVFAVVATGEPLAAIKAEHTGYAASHSVWGVPTFVKDDKGHEALFANTGVYGDHTYTVMDAFEKNGVKYIKLRNPWGESEPSGNGKDDGIFQLKLDDMPKWYSVVWTCE